MNKNINLGLGLMMLLFVAACGTKEDDQTKQIFEQGKIDPNLIPNNVGYVPQFPFFTGFLNPVDVYVGYDELVYVVDDRGLNILDQTGKLAQVINIPGATDVTQDRHLHTYVIGRIEDPILGNRAAIYHLTNTATGNYQIIDTLIHPLNDDSRRATSNRQADDQAVQFTGIATLHDNTVYVTRTGPRNDVNSFVRPDNGVLVYDADGKNIGFATGLSPINSSLKSALGISSIATYSAPPQRIQGMSTSKSFLITQADGNQNVEYRTLMINVFDDPELGTQYAESPQFLSFDFNKADRFLYQSFRFKKPEDCYIAPDNLGYMFVVDSETDSLYIFTPQGSEGVNPPANSGITKQLIVSFGGSASDGTNTGPFSFNDPSGVCYNRRTIYVADKKNNRICRYKLSTDLE
ncbi:MAG: hypothetical protein KBE91_05755 [Bacteroidia bacterium]|nr:hypothetical protein [Bacteroidia bacterium]